MKKHLLSLWLLLCTTLLASAQIQSATGKQHSVFVHAPKKSRQSSTPSNARLAATKVALDSLVDNTQGYKYTYQYNANGYDTTDIEYTWNSTSNIWVSVNKNTYHYDAKGNDTTQIGYSWNTSSNIWVNDWKSIYQYNVNGNNTAEIDYSWNSTSNTWENNSKYIYLYDTQNNDTTQIGYKWNSVSNTWVNSWKSTYKYDANGNKTVEIGYQWNTTSNAWENNWKYIYQYDANNNDTTEIDSEWNTTSNTWDSNWKSNYQYDANGNMTTEIDYQWDSDNNVWSLQGKYVYTFDLSVPVADVMLPPDFINQVKNQPLSYTTYTWNGFDWDESGAQTLYYSNSTSTTGISDPILATDVKPYPNPTTNELFVSGNVNAAVYQITNISGIKVQSGEYLQGNAIQVQALTPGLYFLQLSTDQGAKSFKFLKQ